MGRRATGGLPGAGPDGWGFVLATAFGVAVGAVIGGLASLTGSAAAAVVVGLVQQLANYYAAAGVGDLSVVLLLAAVLLARPGGLTGRTA